jgi:hypothetical protein
MLGRAGVNTGAKLFVAVVLGPVAWYHLLFALHALPANLALHIGRTLARELVHTFGASTAVHARRRGALIDIDLTVEAHVAVATLTRVLGDLVVAPTVVLARVRAALVEVGFARRADEARLAVACERIDLDTLQTATAMLARARLALIYVQFAQRTGVTRPA